MVKFPQEKEEWCPTPAILSAKINTGVHEGSYSSWQECLACENEIAFVVFWLGIRTAHAQEPNHHIIALCRCMRAVYMIEFQKQIDTEPKIVSWKPIMEYELQKVPIPCHNRSF